MEAQGEYPSASKYVFLSDAKSKIPMQFQCVHTGLGTIADIAGFRPGQKLIGKSVSPEVGQLRTGNLQMHIVA